MNRLIVIGFLGIKRCYLNVSRAEAIRRYRESEGELIEEGEIENIKEISFSEEFGAYDVWKTEGI